MAGAVRQSKIAQFSGTNTISFDSAVLAGSVILVQVASFAGAAPTISDGVNTYSTAVATPSSNNQSRLVTRYAENVAAGATTVTITGAGDHDVVISEWTGLATSGVLDGTIGTAVATSATPSAGATGVLTQADSVVIASMTHMGADQTITEDTGDGFSLLQERQGGSLDQPIAVQYKVVAATTSVTPDWTTGASQEWITHRLVFKAAGAATHFPTIPTAAAGRLLVANQLDTSATRTFPDRTALNDNAGDLLIAIIVAYQTSTGTNAAFSGWTGGFTEFHDSATSTTMAIGCAYKWSTGGETGTFAVTQAGTITGDASMILLCIPGAHATTPPEAGSRASGTTAAADPAAFNPTGWDVEDTLWISVVGSGMTTITGAWDGTGTTAPANYTGRVDTNATDTSVIGDCEAAVAFRQLAAASEDVGTAGVDVSNARNAALVIAVRPAAGANTGAASGAIGWVGSSTGVRRPLGAANGTVGYVGTATGVRAPKGAGSGAIAWGGTAVGGNLGVATGAIGWAGSATGVTPAVGPKVGAANGAISWVGSVSGARAPKGAASGAIGWGGTAVGGNLGVATGAIGWAGTVSGVKRPAGSISGAISWVGSATGTAPTVGVKTGSAEGAISWPGSASGVKPSNGGVSGAIAWAGVVVGGNLGVVLGAIGWSGSVSGARSPKGAASGAIAWVGVANGETPTVGINDGSANGAISWVGAVSGVRSPVGAVVGAVAWAGVVVGGNLGVALGAVTWSGTAQGSAPVIDVKDGEAIGAISWVGLATGSKKQLGAAFGAITWVGLVTALFTVDPAIFLLAPHIKGYRPRIVTSRKGRIVSGYTPNIQGGG